MERKNYVEETTLGMSGGSWLLEDSRSEVNENKDVFPHRKLLSCA